MYSIHLLLHYDTESQGRSYGPQSLKYLLSKLSDPLKKKVWQPLPEGKGAKESRRVVHEIEEGNRDSGQEASSKLCLYPSICTAQKGGPIFNALAEWKHRTPEQRQEKREQILHRSLEHKGVVVNCLPRQREGQS